MCECKKIQATKKTPQEGMVAIGALIRLDKQLPGYSAIMQSCFEFEN
jgi:hypothetical protein